MLGPRISTFALLVGFALFPLKVSAQAEAQPARSSATSLPGPSPAKSVAPTRRQPRPNLPYRHDGFYLRLGSGLGYGLIRGTGTLLLAAGDPGSDATVTYKGWGPAYELLIGQTLAPGTVVGGGVVGQRLWKPKVTMEHSALRVRSDATFDDLGEGSITVGLIGPFVDWFPQEGNGLHWGGMLGLALLGLNQGKTGAALSLWGGHDFWISSEWSLGIQACLVALQSQHSLSHYSGTLDDLAINGALLFTALYN